MNPVNALPLLLPSSSEPKLKKTINSDYRIHNKSLWLCLYLPRLSLELLTLTKDNKPYVVITEQAGKLYVHTACDLSIQHGIESNMALNAAYALCPNLQIQRRNEQKEIVFLKQLADWAQQFTSVVSIVTPNKILLELYGSLSLFGGLSSIINRIEHKFSQQWQHRFYLSVSPTPLASELLAQFSHRSMVRNNTDLHSVLGKHSINTLLLDDKRIINKLNKTGISTLQDIWRLPRDGLARRFGVPLIKHLDQLLGLAPDIRSLHHLPIRFEKSIALPINTSSSHLILLGIKDLLQQLETFLRQHDAGINALIIHLLHIDFPQLEIPVSFRQISRSSEHIFKLIEEKIERTQLKGAVSDIVLSVTEVHPFIAHNQALFHAHLLPSKQQPSDPEWENTLEQIQNKFGQYAVQYLQVLDEYQPELAWCYQSALPVIEHTGTAMRPLWLLSQPLHLISHNKLPYYHGPMSFLQGPERIETGWWRGKTNKIMRDYYIVSDINHSRLWVFRDLTQKDQWYLHGYFG